MVGANYTLINIEKCPVCELSINDSSNTFLNPQNKTNFYVDAISADFHIDLEDLNNRLNLIHCGNCYSYYFNYWFDHSSSNKIFNLIYGQHNYGWQNYFNFINKQLFPNHGNLFNRLFEKIDVNTYGEFNCPYSGLYFHLMDYEFNINNEFIGELAKKSSQYIESRQLAKMFSTNSKQLSQNKTSLVELSNFRDQNRKYSKLITKYLLYDSSSLCWGYNCISNNINCKTLGQLFFDYDVINIAENNNLPKFDCIGLYMVLDHIYQPMNLLNKLLDYSKILVLHLHTNINVTKQHMFSFSKKFIKYLKKEDINSIDITHLINKDKNRNKGQNYIDNQMYVICSKKETLLSQFK